MLFRRSALIFALSCKCSQKGWNCELKYFVSSRLSRSKTRNFRYRCWRHKIQREHGFALALHTHAVFVPGRGLEPLRR